jgi:hypothetical protein
MPNIPTYENPIDKLQIPNTGVAAMETLGRVSSRFGLEQKDAIKEGAAAIGRGATMAGEALQQGWNKAEDAETQLQITQGIKAAGSADLQFQQSMMDIGKLDPNDQPAALHALSEKTAAAHDAYMANFTTTKSQQHGERAWAEMNNRWQMRILEHGSNAQGLAASGNIQAGLNMAAAGASMERSEAGIRSQAKQFSMGAEATIANTPGTLESHARMRENIRTGVTKIYRDGTLAIIEGDPDHNIPGDPASGRRLVEKFAAEGLLSPEERNALMSHSLVKDRTIASEARMEEAQQRKAEDEKLHAVIGKINADQINTATGKFEMQPNYLSRILRDAASLPGFARAPHAIETAVKFYQSEEDRLKNGKDDVTDPDVLAKFRAGMVDAANPLTESQVFAARADHKLSDKDFQFYRQWVGEAVKNPQLAKDERDFGRWAESMKPFFTRATQFNPSADPYGTQRFGQWQLDMETEMRQRRAAGESITDITKDMTRADRVQPYQKGLNQPLDKRFTLPGETPAVPMAPVVPIKPGESSEDYLKRIGK